MTTQNPLLYDLNHNADPDYLEHHLPDAPPLAPELRMLVAMIELAVKDLTVPIKEVEFEQSFDALIWIFSDCTEFQPFSFVWACHHLDIDPEVIRVRVAQNILPELLG